MRQFLLVLLALLCGSVWLARASASPSDRTTAGADAQAAALRYLGGEVRRYQHATWHWQRTMGVRLTRTHGRVLQEMSVPDAQRSVSLWRRHALWARRRAQHPPHLGDWLCIHRYEASWWDHGAPYYGGLQMDSGFMRHYAPALLRAKGTADHWTPLEQIWVAEKARRSGRGYYPWPNTARMCGLI